MMSDGNSSLLLLAEIFHRHSVPLLAIDSERHILFQNNAAQKLLKTRSCLKQRAGLLQLQPASAQTTLENLIALDSARGTVPRVRGMRVPRIGALRDWLILVHPLVPAHAGTTQPRVSAYLLQIVGRIWPRDLLAPATMELFGLTPAEMAVVGELSRGSSIDGAAKSLTLSRETIRSHMKRIFRKCEVASKPELLALLTGLATFGAER